MVQKPRGICRICGKNRTFFDESLKLCSECSEKYHNGVYTEADLRRRIQGKSVQLQFRQQAPEAVPSTAAEAVPSTAAEAVPSTAAEAVPSTAAEAVPATAAEAVPATAAEAVPEVYRCEICNTIVRYGQKTCKKCGYWQDWRGTKAETDPDLIICPECGSVVDPNTSVCDHCGFGDN